ncbi:HIT domain-containing protein [bacterium]|nr:HIT domain-containing protein [bacterium]
MSARFYTVIGILIGLVLGLGSGVYLFSDTCIRQFVPTEACNKNCWTPAKITGFITSVWAQKLPSGTIPDLVYETDKSIMIKHPFPSAPIHYVIFPKKDIKEVGDFSQDDLTYIEDAYAVMGRYIREEKYHGYKIFTNGPGYQHIGYLHFHLMAR